MDCVYNNGVCATCGRTMFTERMRRRCDQPPPLITNDIVPIQAVVTSGPGTALKRLLSTIGITATPACSCNARAAEMDRQGADWCEANIDTIVGWLREEADKRGLPFLDIAGRLLVKRAIRNARRLGKAPAPPAQTNL